jgi:hypothetical protein
MHNRYDTWSHYLFIIYHIISFFISIWLSYALDMMTYITCFIWTPQLNCKRMICTSYFSERILPEINNLGLGFALSRYSCNFLHYQCWPWSNWWIAMLTTTTKLYALLQLYTFASELSLPAFASTLFCKKVPTAVSFNCKSTKSQFAGKEIIHL